MPCRAGVSYLNANTLKHQYISPIVINTEELLCVCLNRQWPFSHTDLQFITCVGKKKEFLLSDVCQW